MDISGNKNLVYGAAIAMTAVGIGWQTLTNPAGTGPGDVARVERLQTAKQQAQLRSSLEREESNKAIAEKRFSNGCMMVVGLARPDMYVSLAQSPVLDPTTRRPLPQGTVVCDSNGNTGVLDVEGIPTLVAQTADRKVIQKQMQTDAQAGIKPALQTIPQQGVKNDRSATR